MHKFFRKIRFAVPDPGRSFLGYLVTSILLILISASAMITVFSADLPELEDLEKIPEDLAQSTVVYSADNVELRTFQAENRKRIWVQYEEIPEHVIDAFLAAEDSRFFHHWGFSTPDMMRALKVNFTTGRRSQGASTITQQLSRDLFLTREKTMKRKFQEILVAIRIEHTYSKTEILEMFLNITEFSGNSLGIEAAANNFFGKSATELTIPEAATLAGVLQAPTRLNPRRNMEESEARRNIVLGMMLRNGKITSEEYQDAVSNPIMLTTPTELFGRAPYFVQYIERQLVNKYGENFVYTQGAKVYTTIDSRLQDAAEEALTKQLEKIQALFDAGDYVRPAGLTGQRAVQDSISKTVVQGALIAMDIRNGNILAMVGGSGFSDTNMFNRAIQSTRQAGSAFKPFLYTAALDNGWRCSDTVFDAQVSYSNPDGTYWEPKNFEEGFRGEMTLREAFNISQNIPAVKLQNDSANRGLGARTVAQYARQMGITSRIPEVRSLSVGTAPVRLIDITTAFGVFPNYGIKIEPVSIREVWDRNNSRILYQPEGMRSEALRPEVAALMVTLMETAMTQGTGWTARNILGDRHVGGKTGTGQDYKDAWFIGFTPYIVCGVWIGFDSEETTLKYPFRTGSTAALPVWAEFIEQASTIMNLPKAPFDYRKYVTTQRLCPDSHRLPTQFCPSIYTEYFLPDNGVIEFCNIHGRRFEVDDIDPRFRQDESRGLRGR